MIRGALAMTLRIRCTVTRCFGTTNLVGVASCTITKLTQKPGNYFLTASFAGNGDYLASSVNLAFKIGS